MSNRAFTIERIPDTTPPTLRLLSPNGGESWKTLETKTILWEASDPLNAWETSDNPDRVKIEIYYSYDGGRTWSKVPDRFPLSNTGSYRWNIPHDPRESYPLGNCLVKVEAFDLVGNRSSDMSDSSFTIAAGDLTPPTVRVVTPNGGEVWKVGERRTINWNASDNVAVSKVNISFKASGRPFERIAADLPHTGSYGWIVPDTPSTDTKIYITVWDSSGNEASDASDRAFTIEALSADTRSPTLTIISPSPESVVKGGREFDLRVRATDDVGIRDFTIKVDNIVRDTVTAISGTDITQTLHPRVYGTERHVVTVIATDTSGKTAERFMGIYSDDAPPTISNIWPPPASLDDPHRLSLRTSQSTVAIRADIIDRGMAGVKEVRLLDDRGRILATRYRPYAGNTYIFDYTRPSGARSVACYIRAFDKVDNYSNSNMINIVWEEPPLRIEKPPLIPKQPAIPKEKLPVR